MFEKFTSDAMELMNLAFDEGKSLYHNFLSPEMIIAAFIKRNENIPEYLKNISYNLYREKMVNILGNGPKYRIIMEMPLTPNCKRLFQQAAEKEIVTSEHLVNTILGDPEELAFRFFWEAKLEIYNTKLSLLVMSQIIEKNLPQEIFKKIITKI